MAFYDPPKSSLGRRRVAANPLPIPPPEQANSSFRADKSPLLTKLFPEAARSASDNESNWQAQEMQRQREQQAQLEQRTREKIARREAELKARKEADEEAKARAAEEKALAKQAEDDRKAKEKEALIAENTAFETKARAAGLGSDLYKADDNRWRLPYGEEEMQARSELNKRAAEEEAKKKAIDAEIASLSAEKGIKPYVTVEETKQAEKDLEEIFPVARSKALGSIDAKAQEFEKRGKSFFGLGGDPVAAKEAEKLKAKYEGLISDPNGLDEEELNAADPVTAARYKTAKEKLEATKQAKAWHDAMETKISMLKLKRDNPAKWEELQAKELANAPDADLGKMSDEIKATDAGTTAQAQEREKLLQQNREKLSAGVAPGETVTTADGQVVHKDLAPELEKLTPTKDPDADVKRKLISDEIQRRIAINDAKVKEYYGRLRSSPLYADLADKYEALDAEQATRLKEVDDKASDPAQYKEMRGIVIDDIRNKRNAIEEAKAGRIEIEKKIFALADQYMQDYDVTLNAGLGRGDNTKIELEKAKEIISRLKERHDKSRDKLAKELGIDTITAYKASEDYIQASKPWLDVGIDGSRILPSGAVMVNPKAIWDTGALEKAKEFVTRNFSAIGKDPVKGAEMVDKQVADMRERSSHEVFADLMDAPVFQKWLEKNKLPGDKGMTGEQKAGLILKFNQDKTWWDRLSNDAKQGLYAGLTDLQQGAWSISTAGSDGLYAATGLQYFRDIADGKRSVAEMYGRDVESLSRSRTAVGKFDLIPGISVGDVAQAAPSIAVSMLPGVALARLSQAKKLGVLTKILTGAKAEMTAEKALQVAGVAGMRGATAGAFVQSFASSYGQARSGFMAQGMSRDEAEQQALWSATKAGLSTAALTRLFGLHGAEAALGSNPTMREMFKVIGKDGLRNSLKSPKFRKLFADSLGDLGMEAISEVPEESMDQFVQGLMEKASYNPDKTWKEVFDETMNAGGVALFLGGAGPLVAGAKGMAADATEKILAKGQSNPATPAANPATPAIPAPNTPAATPENIVKATSDIANAPPPADAADTGIDWPATQTAATAIVQIGTGNIAALSDDELKSVGLTRNDKGVIEQSQPGKDSPAPLVKMENGEPIILDAGTALLEQHFPDARQLIAQTEGERRAEIEAQQQQDQQTTTEDPSTPEAPTSDTPQPTDAGATESPPSDTATAAPPGTGPAGVDTNSLPDYEQQIVSILEESYGFPSDDAKAIAKDHLARRGVTKTDANGVPDAQMQVLEDVESELGQAGIQDVTEKTDGISKRYLKRFAKDRKAAETARATANEQRASALADRLGSEDARVGLRSGEGKIDVRKWVRNNPVPLDANGNPDVDADFKAFRESIAADDIPMGPSNPIRQKTPSEERAEQAKAKAASTAELDPESKVRALLKENPKATMAELQAVAPGQTKAWYADQKKAAIPKVDAEVSTKEGKTPGGQASKTASKATLPRNISTAVGKLPDALRPKALKLLKPLLETLRKYESVEIFSDIRFVAEFPAGTGGMRLAPDGALEIHLPTVANDSIKRIRAALSEEAIHAIAVRVIDKAQVVSLWNSLPKELQQAVRKVYFASYEVNGETLPEGDAFSMGHEAIRMMVQDKAFLGRITEAQGLAGKVKAILETLLSELRRMIDAAPAEAKRELEAARDSVISALEEVGIIESRAIAESAPANESPATRELSRRENAANKLRSMMGLPPLNASPKVTAGDDARYLELAKDPEANSDALQSMVDKAAKASGGRNVDRDALIDPKEIEPVNEIDKPDQVKRLTAIMRKEGWIGRPLLIADEGDRLQAYTGSHRLAAAVKAGLAEIPVVTIPVNAVAEWINGGGEKYNSLFDDYQGFSNGRESDKLDDLKRARRDGVAGLDASIDLLEIEDESNFMDASERSILYRDPWIIGKRVKSAEPVTYDETGNVIPLSQRFNPDAGSILYAGEKPTEPAIDYKSAEFRNVASELGNSLYEAGFTDPMAFASELNTLLDGNGDARLFGRIWTESEGYNPDDDQPKWGQLLAEIRKPVATEELSPAKAEAPTDSLPADGSTPGGVDQPVTKKTKARTIPTVKSKASEIIRSGMFETIAALADIKIAPPSPAIPLIRSREKRGMKLSELEMKLLRDNRDYDGYPSQKSVMDRGDGGKVAAEILSRIMSGKERPDNAADFWRQGSKPSEMWDALVEELYAVAEGRGTAMDEARDSYEEGKANEMEAQLDRFEAANRPTPGRTEIDAKTLTVGDKLVVDGEILTVSGLEMNQETGEADTVILDDHYRFGRQFLEGGDSVFVEEAWSGEGWNNYENAPDEAPQTQRTATPGQELFQPNEMPFNLVAETTEDIRKREEAEIKAENDRKAKEAAAAKAENDKLQGNLFDQSPVADRIDTARADVDQSPTDAQKEAGNYRKGHVSIQGLAITIENPKGSVRSGKDEDGKAWTVEMKNDYGYLKRTEGKDGDQVDVFIGPVPESPRVFVVNQLRQKPGSPPKGFDEHKVMIGFPDQASAVEGYLGNYSPGWRVGPVAEMTMDEFKDWLANGDTSKPVKGAETPIADTRDDETKMRDFLKDNPNATMTEMVAIVPDQLKSWYAKQRQAARDLEARPQTSAEMEQKAESGTNAQLAQKALDPVAANTDFGEKIGGARKDLAIATGGSTTKKIASSDTVPKWQKGYAIVQVMSDRRNPENAGRWTFQKTAEKPSFGGWNNAPVFNTEEEAKLALPAWIVTKKHRVMSASGNGDKYAIRRIVTDRKSVEIKTGFDTREEASKYLIDNALEILNTKTGFGEEILSPREDQKIYRKGTDRRTTNATQQMFMDTFAPRGVEFGNWITTDEGQEVLNHAYDGLLDLADVIGVPPKALFLNGDLALAFGARGQGLSGARAHYEPDRVVINLTKMSGAGSLAHEWMHAVDHYFARQEGRTRADWATNSDGTRSLMVKGTPETKNNIFVSSGKYRGKSGMREEVSKAWENFRQTMLKKTVQRDVDVAKLKKWQDRAAENLKDTLGRIRQYLATEQTYGTRKAPATADQLSRWDQAVEKLTSGNAGPLEWKMPKSIKQKLDQEDAKRDKAKKAGKFVGRSSVSFKHMWLNDAFEELSDIHKEVRNRSGLSGEKPVLDMAIFSYKDLLKRKSEFEMKEATATESASVPTDFVREAYLGDLGRVKDYWQEPWELAARAFSSYIEDKVKEKGAKSGFLSTGSSESDNIFFKMMYGFMPYPSGSERAEINKSLDNLFGTLQTKETDRGVALYSSPPVPQPGGNTTSGPGQHPLRAFVEPEGTDWGLYGRKVSKPGKDSWTTAERDAVAKTFDAAGIKPIMISPTTGQPIDDSFIVSAADQKQLIAALLERRRDRQAKAKANGATQQKIDDFVEKAHKAQRGIGWALAKVVAAPARLISWAMPKGVAKALDVVGNNNIDKAFVSAIERAATGVASTDVAKGVAKAMNSLAGTKGGQVTAEIAQNLIHWAKKNFIPQSLWGKEFAAKIREMNVTKQFMTETSMDVIRALKGTEKFTDLMMPERWRTDTAMHERIWRVLDGQADIGTLPKELHHTVKMLRELSRKAGLEAVRTGRMSLETFRAMDQSGYVTHYYDTDKESVLDKIVRRVPVLKNQGYVHARRMEAWRIEDTQTKDPNAPGMNALINFQPGKFRFGSQGHRDAFYEQFIREQVVEDIKNSRPKGLSSAANQAISTLTAPDLLRLERLPADLRGYISRITEQQRSRFLKKRPLTQDEKEKAGLIMDPFYATARHILQMGHDNATAKFFNEVVKLPDVVSSTDIAGFKKIADDARFGALRGKYVREDLHEQLQEIANVNDSVMRIADNMLTLWKTGKTVLNPSTHFRNIMGNVAFSGLAGNNVLNPAKWENYRRSIRAIRDGGTDLKLLIENGITGNDFASAELAQALKRMLPNADLVDTEKGPMETIGMFLKGALNAGLGKAFDLYGIEDDFYKAATFFKYLQDGKTAEEAATETRKWFPYYDQIGTSGALKWTRRVVPFFSFQREALRIMGNAAKERPLMLTVQLSMFWGLNQLSMMVLGLRDEDKEDVDKELRGHLKLTDAPVFSMLLPWRDSEGRLQQWDMSNIMPFANFLGRNVGFDRTEDPASSELLKLLTAQNPFVSLLISHISNKDAYTGKPIWEDSMTPEEKRGKAFGHAWNVLVPPLMGTSLDVLKNAGTRTTNKSLETRNTPQAWARSIAGFDIRNASPDFYDAVDKYMTKHEMPGKPGGQWSSTPEYRARAELWGQLVQDEPDYRKAGALLKYLKTEHQETFDTPKSLSGLLDTRNPLKALGADEKRKMTAAEVKADFLSSLSGETGDAVRKSLAEFERIKMQAPARLEKAKAFMK